MTTSAIPLAVRTSTLIARRPHCRRHARAVAARTAAARTAAARTAAVTPAAAHLRIL
jgi:hypothetical protein